jgi:DNA-binding beta-propeller fold protein YncE
MAYVAERGRGQVLVFDTKTGASGEPIYVGDEPSAVAITPDGRKVYKT